MEVNNTSWWESSCGPKSRELFNGSTSLAWNDYPFQVGHNCNAGDNGIVSVSMAGYADNMYITPGAGGFVTGRIRWSGGRAVNTTDGIVVLEQLNSRRWVGGSPLPSGSYELSFSGSGVMVWFGNSSTTPAGEGVQISSNVNTYILACVDINNNSQCDFAESLF